MSLQIQLTNLTQAIGADIKILLANQGNLAALTTTEKSNLVAAINELQALVANAATISDTAGAGDTTHTWSANKIVLSLAALKDEILGGAGAAYDTLKELQDLITGDQSQVTDILTALGNRVRVDAAQTFTAQQQAQGRANIDAASTTQVQDAQNAADAAQIAADTAQGDVDALTTAVGNTETNFVAIYNAAKA